MAFFIYYLLTFCVAKFDFSSSNLHAVDAFSSLVLLLTSLSFVPLDYCWLQWIVMGWHFLSAQHDVSPASQPTILWYSDNALPWQPKRWWWWWWWLMMIVVLVVAVGWWQWWWWLLLFDRRECRKRHFCVLKYWREVYFSTRYFL